LAVNFSANRGKLLENLVAIELRRRGKEFFYFRNKGECDFVLV
jgi:predicted AAA+ superfamily ATPase